LPLTLSCSTLNTEELGGAEAIAVYLCRGQQAAAVFLCDEKARATFFKCNSIVLISKSSNLQVQLFCSERLSKFMRIIEKNSSAGEVSLGQKEVIWRKKEFCFRD
jgi:hypothetical protein